MPTPYFGQALSISALFGGAGGGFETKDPMNHSVVASAVRLLADTVADIDFVVSSSRANGAALNINHPAAMIINQPVLTTKRLLIFGIVEGLISSGNAYLIPDRIKGLRLVDWRNMRPPDKEIRNYRESVPLTGTVIQWPPEQVVHILSLIHI